MWITGVFIAIISQGLLGSGYVITESNSYYSMMRSTPIESLFDRLSTLIIPNYHFGFPQDHNEYLWEKNENTELSELRQHQIVIYNIIKCLLQEDDKNICKIILDSTAIFFDSYPDLQIQIKKPVGQVNLPNTKDTVMKIKEESDPPTIVFEPSANQGPLVLEQKFTTVESSKPPEFVTAANKITSQVSITNNSKELINDTIVPPQTTIDNEDNAPKVVESVTEALYNETTIETVTVTTELPSTDDVTTKEPESETQK